MSEISAEDCTALCNIYESVFNHRQFTGRSGAMYKYEGLGCTYWHMVSKLLLAAQETYWSAADAGEPAELLDRLRSAYLRIRDGLGFVKDPDRELARMMPSGTAYRGPTAVRIYEIGD